MKISFAGGMKLDAHVRGHTIRSDQTEKGGGEYSAPTPLETMVASLGTCMGVSAVNYIKANGASAEGLEIDLEYEVAKDPVRLTRARATLRAPNADLGPKRRALVTAAGNCPVHRAIKGNVDVEIELA
jgi:ribosomal protein S12 methylthiotransferase accessory factor